MAGALAAAGAAVAAADLWLVLICWSHRAVLGAVLGAVGIPLVAFAIASGLTSSAAEGALAIALILLLIGIVLYSLGQAFERLLDEPPTDEREMQPQNADPRKPIPRDQRGWNVARSPDGRGSPDPPRTRPVHRSR